MGRAFEHLGLLQVLADVVEDAKPVGELGFERGALLVEP
jgi:hypothetical protein